MSWLERIANWFVSTLSTRPLLTLLIIFVVAIWILFVCYLYRKLFLETFWRKARKAQDTRKRKETAEARMEIFYRSLQAEEDFEEQEEPSEQLIVCTICNSVVPSDSAFCPACGSERKREREEEILLPRDGLPLTKPLFYPGENLQLHLGSDQKHADRLPVFRTIIEEEEGDFDFLLIEEEFAEEEEDEGEDPWGDAPTEFTVYDHYEK